MDDAAKGLLSRNRRRLLAALLRGKSKPTPAPAPLTAELRQDPTTLSKLTMNEQRVWYLTHLTGQTVFNLHQFIQFDGEFHVQAFRDAVQQLVDTYVQLRTGFPVVDGRPLRKIHARVEVSVPEIDVRDVPREEQLRRIGLDASGQFLTSATLAHPPLVYHALYRVGPSTWIWVQTLQHIIGDAISSQVLTDDVIRLYLARAAGRPINIQSHTGTVLETAEYAYWQRLHGDAHCRSTDLQYWVTKLEKLMQSDWQARAPSHPGPPDMRTRGFVTFLEGPEVTALDAASKSLGVTLFATSLACVGALVHHCTGASQVWLGTNTSGREYPELLRTIGFFATDTPLCLDVSGNPSLAELAVRCRAELTEALSHATVPLPVLADLLTDRAHPSLSNRLFRALAPIHVAFATRQLQDDALGEGVSAHPVSFEVPDSCGDQDLWLLFIKHHDGMWIISTQHEQGVPPDLCDVFMATLKQVMACMAADPATTLDGLEQRMGPQLARARDTWRKWWTPDDGSSEQLDLRLEALLAACADPPPALSDVAHLVQRRS